MSFSFRAVGRACAGLLVAAAAAIVAMYAMPVLAATCGAASVTTDVGVAASSCSANIAGGNGGNVTEAEMNGNAVFGLTGWSSFGKIDVPGTSGGFLEIGYGADNLSGTWKLADGYKLDPLGSYALVLKAGSPGNDNAPGNGKKPSAGGGSVYNVAYLLDLGNTSGTWSTADLLNNGGQQPGLSNITLMGTASPAPVPLPAAAWLLLAGVGALGAAARRKAA